MVEWVRDSFSTSLTAEGADDGQDILHNSGAQLPVGFPEEGGHLTVVDGIVTVQVDTDDLVAVQLVVAHELVTITDLTTTVPSANDPAIHYRWYTSRGPAFFRIRSKKSVPQESRYMLHVFKARGANASNVRIGWNILFNIGI